MKYDTFLSIQVSLVIRGRYVPSFRTANLEFADKIPFLTGKLSFLTIFPFWISEFAGKKSANYKNRLDCTSVYEKKFLIARYVKISVPAEMYSIWNINNRVGGKVSIAPQSGSLRVILRLLLSVTIISKSLAKCSVKIVISWPDSSAQINCMSFFISPASQSALLLRDFVAETHSPLIYVWPRTHTSSLRNRPKTVTRFQISYNHWYLMAYTVLW